MTGDSRYNTALGCREMSAEFAQKAVVAESTAISIAWLGKARALLGRAVAIEQQGKPAV